MEFQKINFAGQDGGTIGFIRDNIVEQYAVDKNNYAQRKYGNITLTSDKRTTENVPDFKIAEYHTKNGVPASPPNYIYLPVYEFMGLNTNQAFLCVAKKCYGEIGDFVTLNFTVVDGDARKTLTQDAIIVEHLENFPENDDTMGAVGLYSKDGIVRSYEVSIVVMDEQGMDWNTWCGKARWYFCNRNATGEYSNSYLESIVQRTSLNGDNNSLITENASSSDFLLKNSEDERKYGINIFEASQPLIRFTTSSALNQGSNPDALKALESYSRFMYALLNSQVSTANYVLVGMPWLRPGFNTWVDPLYSDTVYYISEVQQQGNPIDGATTVVSLIHGRPRGKFVADSNAFGSISDSSDNVFINSMKPEYRVKGEYGFGPWGEYLETADDFKNAKAATQDYYSHEIEGTVAASTSQFHRAMYVDGVKPAPVAENADKTKIFNGEYTAAEIKAKIDAIYASAPAVVKERSAKLKRVVEEARKYINIHYDGEKRV